MGGTTRAFELPNATYISPHRFNKLCSSGYAGSSSLNRSAKSNNEALARVCLCVYIKVPARHQRRNSVDYEKAESLGGDALPGILGTPELVVVAPNLRVALIIHTLRSHARGESPKKRRRRLFPVVAFSLSLSLSLSLIAKWPLCSVRTCARACFFVSELSANLEAWSQVLHPRIQHF